MSADSNRNKNVFVSSGKKNKSQAGYYGDRLKMNAVPTRAAGGSHGSDNMDAPRNDFWASSGISSSPMGLGFGVPSLFNGKGSGSAPKALDWGETELDSDFHDFNVNVKHSGGPGLIDVVTPMKSRNKMPELAELDEAPEWMETNTTFVSDLGAEETMSALEAALERSRTEGKCEHAIKISKHKITGTVLLPDRAHFTVKFYRGRDSTDSASESNVVVEFQRRSGCARSFRAFYHDTLDILGGMGNWCQEWQPRPYGAHSFAEPAPGIEVEAGEIACDDVGNWEDTVTTLITMASLELVDVQLDALSALETLSKHSESKDRLAELLVPEFQRMLLSSSNEEVVILSKKIFTNVGL